MRIIYYSKPFFADCDFPLIREMQRQGHVVYYFIDLAPYSLRTTLFNITHIFPKNQIIYATSYPELKIYSSYMDMSHVFIINRTSKKAFALSNIILTYKSLRIFKNLNAEIFHVDTVLDCSEIMFYSLRKKMIMTIHDPFPHIGASSFRLTFFRNLAFRLVKKFVLLNIAQKERFIFQYKINPKQICLNNLGPYTCLNIFKHNKVLRKPKNILFFGRIAPYKGIEILLEAMIKIHSLLPEASLTIAGGGEFYFDYTPYKNICYIELINHYINMVELADLLNATDVVVCPYTEATQSGVIMTAYSMFKPVITTNVGGLSEMVDDGKTGILIKPNSVDSLTQALVRMLSDENNLKIYSQNIKSSFFSGEKSWKVIVSKYINFYNK